MKRFKIFGSIEEYKLKDFVEFVDENKSRKLEILICSSGGSGEAALGICDYMKASKKEFTTIGIGRVESAALSIFFSGDKRFAYKNTIFMTHKGALENNSILNRFENNKKLNLFNKASQEIIPLKIKRKRQYFSSKDLFEMGFIDKIIK